MFQGINGLRWEPSPPKISSHLVHRISFRQGLARRCEIHISKDRVDGGVGELFPEQQGHLMKIPS